LVTVTVTTALATAVAVLLNEAFPGRRVLSALVLLPWATPSIVNGLMWKWIYDPNFGALNAVLKFLGLIDSYVVWLGDPSKSLMLIANAAVWKQMPLAAILLLVTMKAIPADLYRAARVDGANVFQRFMHVTLPGMKPGLMLVLVYETMISIRHFDLFLIMTQGGPGDATYTISWQIYVETFRSLKFGIGAALSYLLAIATFVLAYAIIRGLAHKGRE
jgi:multiple sugar transport system permease protein